MGTQATKSYQAGKENAPAVAEQTHAENKPGPGETKPPRDILLSLTWAQKRKAFAVRFPGPVLTEARRAQVPHVYLRTVPPLA